MHKNMDVPLPCIRAHIALTVWIFDKAKARFPNSQPMGVEKPIEAKS
jgi:hypothetical protein